jgi:hypothetical protein
VTEQLQASHEGLSPVKLTEALVSTYLEEKRKKARNIRLDQNVKVKLYECTMQPPYATGLNFMCK